MPLKEKLKWFDPFTYVDVFVMPKLNPSKNRAVDWVVYIFFAFFFAFIIYSVFGLLFGTTAPAVIVVTCSMDPTLVRGDIIGMKSPLANEISAETIVLDIASLKDASLDEFAVTYCRDNYTRQIDECEKFKQRLKLGQIDINSFNTEYVVFKDGQRLDIKEDGDIVLYYSYSTSQPIIHRAVAKIVAQEGEFFLTKGDSVNNPLVDQETYIAPNALKREELQGVAFFRIPRIGLAKLWVFDDLPRLVMGLPPMPSTNC